MYTIVAVVGGKEFPLHNLKSRRLIVGEPYYEIGDNVNGQAEFIVYPGHPYYGMVRKLTTDIIVRKDGRDEFYGRVLYDDEDFRGAKHVFVEGELAFFCDSIQRQKEYHNIGVRDYLINLVNIHNEQVEERKRFTVGRVTVTDANDSLYRVSNYETTRELLSDRLVDRLGGHFVIRHENGVRYLDYLSDDDYYSRCTQKIEFGKNLLDFARNFDASQLATCVIPLGARLEESSSDVFDERLTISSVNGGIDYVTDDAAVAEYGKIYKTVIFDDITLPANLKEKGMQYLRQIQYEKIVLECTAIDLAITGEEFERFVLGSQVNCVSKPHGMDAWYPVTRQRFYLTQFEKNTITLGEEADNTTYTSSNRQSSATFREDLETYRTALTERIKQAQQEFKNAIENANGLYSTDVVEENGSVITYYHNKKDLDSSSIRIVISDAGIAVTNNAGEDWYGLEVDGDMIAKILNAYGVNAGWINTGVLRVTDGKGNEVLYVNVDTGEVRIMATEFSLTGGKTIGDMVNDAVDGLTQQEIFDKLTGGKKQGIFLVNGELYISGEFMKIGKISSKNGKVYFDLDNNELHCDTLVSTSTNTSVENTIAKIGHVYIGGSSETSGFGYYGMAIYREGYSRYGMALSPDTDGTNPSTIVAGESGICLRAYNRNNSTAPHAGIMVSANGYVMVAGGQTARIFNSSFIEGEGTTSNGTYGRIVIHPDWVKTGSSSYSRDGVIRLNGSIEQQGPLVNFSGTLTCTGGKNRRVTTEHYGERLLYCYETTSAMFGDVGEGETDDGGECYISLDDIFSETVAAQIEYQVFLQKEGQGDIWVEEKSLHYFVVRGTPGLKFSWEVKAKQKDFEYERLGEFEHLTAFDPEIHLVDMTAVWSEDEEKYIREQEEVLLSEKSAE